METGHTLDYEKPWHHSKGCSRQGSAEDYDQWKEKLTHFGWGKTYLVRNLNVSLNSLFFILNLSHTCLTVHTTRKFWLIQTSNLILFLAYLQNVNWVKHLFIVCCNFTNFRFKDFIVVKSWHDSSILFHLQTRVLFSFKCSMFLISKENLWSVFWDSVFSLVCSTYVWLYECVKDWVRGLLPWYI